MFRKQGCYLLCWIYSQVVGVYLKQLTSQNVANSRTYDGRRVVYSCNKEKVLNDESD